MLPELLDVLRTGQLTSDYELNELSLAATRQWRKRYPAQSRLRWPTPQRHHCPPNQSIPRATPSPT